MTLRRLGVGSAILGASLGAWVVVIAQTRDMGGGPATDLGGLWWYLGLWVTMTAAMMLPSTAPMLLLLDGLAPGRLVPFLGGYLLAWTAYGIGAFALVRAAVGAGLDGWGVTGALLAAAGVYQVTPLKRTCLRRCRSPLAFLRSHWRDGHAGAVRMGAVHGSYCVGCCAGLMAVLFILGMMSVLWMAVVATLVFAEKVAPRGEGLAPVVALALVGAATWMTLA